MTRKKRRKFSITGHGLIKIKPRSGEGPSSKQGGTKIEVGRVRALDRNLKVKRKSRKRFYQATSHYP